MSQGSLAPAAELLRNTPYLIADGIENVERFARVAERAVSTRKRAMTAAAEISQQARGILWQFESAIRSDLVAESNQMEGIRSSAREIQELVRVKSELLDMDVRSFLQHVRDDPRLLESLGLYRAYVVADEWAKSSHRPREYELRGLHSLVMAAHSSAGRYKSAPNEIGGSRHVPTAPSHVPQAMDDLASWFVGGSGDPVLDAAVVHAWLTHVHPFDDGNGRMARLLANLALIQANYPPLLLRSTTDRGQYLDALSASDDGDILPLYGLFVKSLRRAVKLMERDSYVHSVVRHELLANVHQRRQAWRTLAELFYEVLARKARRHGWSVCLMGYPAVDAFDLLERRDSEGSSWFVKFRDRSGTDQWLLWFGYRSEMMVDATGDSGSWPSVFVAKRTDDPRSVHAFKTVFQPGSLEISLIPASTKPCLVRWDHATTQLHLGETAAGVVAALCTEEGPGWQWDPHVEGIVMSDDWGIVPPGGMAPMRE